MHDVVAEGEESYHVPIFNPASNQNQRSILRLVNPGAKAVDFTIVGRDDSGRSEAGEVRLSLDEGAATILDSQQLEVDFGDGTGKWHLTIVADEPIWVVNLLKTPTGHLTNLSTEGVPWLGARSPGEIARLASEVVRLKPTFVGSEVLIFYDGEIERLRSPTCNVSRCSIDDHATSLRELLFASDFDSRGENRGVSLGRGDFHHHEADEALLRYGGWLNRSVFAVQTGQLADAVGTPYEVIEDIIHGYSIGVPSNANPIAGSVSWEGAMVGVDVSLTGAMGNLVRGDATITFSFEEGSVDVAFPNVYDLTANRMREDISWRRIEGIEGVFKASTIQSMFYNPSQTEIGGIFERNEILGAFGAKR